MCQVVHVQAAGSHVSGNQKLYVFDAKLLHYVVALCLAQFAVQRIGVVAILYQFVGDLLRLFAGTAEDDAVDVRVKVGDTFQREVLVLCTDHVVDIADILIALVLVADHDFLRILHVPLRDGSNLLRHGGREEQHVAVFRHFGEDGVDAVGEAHVEHLIRLVHDDILYQAEVHRLAVHQVQEASRSGHYHVHTTFQRLNLALDAGTTVHWENLQVVDILGVVVQIVCDL
ncbi:putative uncharacterized protein [Parabacteroides johnsonii CAG:246]|nr:putative uncharacterized protein [Parabacteroides johnsonii CAG:246]